MQVKLYKDKNGYYVEIDGKLYRVENEPLMGDKNFTPTLTEVGRLKCS